MTNNEKMREAARLCRRVADDFMENTFEDFGTDDFGAEIGVLKEALTLIRELRQAMRKLERGTGIRADDISF